MPVDPPGRTGGSLPIPVGTTHRSDFLSQIAFVTEPDGVVRILDHLDPPATATPPPIAHARGPPPHDEDQTPAFDPSAPEPVPDYELDQTVSW